ncbi:hypothetical protein AcV5_003234 [Taiwanofungus camphoratus]|nr:hypothetical protein AcV5_003234 [Antrodia cinnamomea]KAI0929430.1 hypothetical protein AcV7_005282 [Antrodia cinnamomea]
MSCHNRQQNAGLPNLQAPPRAHTSTAPSNVSQSADKSLAWVVQEYLQHPKPPKWSMRPYQVDMSFIRESKKIGGTPIAHLLLKFFDLWGEDSISASSKVISVREGQPIAREQELMKDVYSTSQVQPVPDVGAIEYLDFQPSQWQYQNLVVQDPFVFTHNHAEFISRTMFEYFIVYARRTAGILRRGHPLSEIFGPHLQVPLPSGSAPERLRVRRVALEHRRSIGKRQPQWGLRSQYHSSAAQHTPASEFELVELPKLVYKKRALTLRRIGSLIKEKYHPKYTVKVFGSTCYNVDSVNSDIDLVIIDPERPSGFAPFVGSPKLPRIYNIRLLARIISAAGYLHVRPVPFATVPIVKFTDPVTGLSCDINVNERLGLVNTAMIRRYCDLEPVLRPLLVAIKAWAKPLGLNDPSGSKGFPTFSSYALTIMAIALFQTTGLLPNLQANVEAVPKTFKSTFWLRKRNDTFVQCDLRYSLRKDWTSEENITPRQALADWFYYWGATHDCGTDAVSLRHGGILPRWKLTEDHSSLDTAVINGLTDDRHLEGRSEGGDSPTSEADSGGSPPLGVPNDPFPWLAPLYVADPFIPAKNLTSRISHTDIKRFREECLRAYQMLETGSTIEELLLGLRKRPAKHYDWMHVNPTVPEDPN